MVTRAPPQGGWPWILALAAALVAGAAVARPASLRVTTVASVEPARFVPANAPETAAECGKLRPSKARLRDWFTHARVVRQPTWLEEGDQSACQISGVVVTGSGARDSFQLGRGGMGRIDAGHGAFVYLLGPELAYTAAVGSSRR